MWTVNETRSAYKLFVGWSKAIQEGSMFTTKSQLSGFFNSLQKVCRISYGMRDSYKTGLRV